MNHNETTYLNGAVAGKKYFDPKVKAQAISRSYDVSLTQAAKEYGIPLSTLSTWRKRSKGRYRRSLTSPATAIPRADKSEVLALARSLIETALSLLKTM